MKAISIPPNTTKTRSGHLLNCKIIKEENVLLPKDNLSVFSTSEYKFFTFSRFCIAHKLHILYGNLKMVGTKNMEIKGLLDLELTEQLNSIYKHYIFIFSLEGS